MCTVTFLTPGDGSFILTQNRDEAPGRAASDISQRTVNGQTIIYPKDAGANGSWIVGSDHGQAACLLNGAFDKHIRKASYRMSRGLLLLSLFNYENANTFVTQVDLQDIEPFTMIIIEPGLITEFVWDGDRRYIQEANFDKMRIWASATLYSKEWQLKRKNWLEAWVKNRGTSAESILDFHQFAGDGDEQNDLVMNRQNKVRTVSITQITRTDHQLGLYFHDLLHDQKVKVSLPTPS